ncbi:MAG: glutamate--tRNA ligase [Ignavibacteriales bacterium]|nr:MAG: glutamate--tRNA ligase [Ignavibacteriales bacterium]
MISEKPRVRFAPSPTGYLHVGGLRTALYNYLYAKKNGGTFVLRIEDTDRNRYVEGAVENLIETLNWCGLTYDEGPVTGGDCGPYIQSERLDIYKREVERLIESGKAYHCFCTAERLTQLREEQQKQNQQTKYDKHCLSLTREERETKISKGEQFVIRLNVEPGAKVAFDDIVRGHVEFDRETIDDQVLLKSDGYPTYHLANVIDDHFMKITHVIRGEEWLSSTPKHVLLYDAFGWERPVFAHLPLLLNPDKSKLSKRQGDVAVEDYKKKGFLKEALVNFVALLGWNAGDDRELFSLKEMEELFTLERVNKSGAVFNLEKLNWMNFEHLRMKSDAEILAMIREELAKSEFSSGVYSDEYLVNIIHAMKERVNFAAEFVSKCPYFYAAPREYEQQSIDKNWKPETPEQLKALSENFAKLENPDTHAFEQALADTAAALNAGKGKLIHPLRLAVSGVSSGPGMFDLLYILGRDEVIRRIDTAVQKIKK